MCPHVSLEMGNVAADMAANTSTDFEGIPFNQLYRKVYDKGEMTIVHNRCDVFAEIGIYPL